jgi:hypothetical protein
MPPHLAGREAEREEFVRLLEQTVILENLILTGLSGVGKTVLLDTFKPIAIEHGWHWVGTDLSESASATEEALATRLLADLSVVSASMTLGEQSVAGFASTTTEIALDYSTLRQIYEYTPGLIADKLKAVLETVATVVARENKRGVIFAYDEAQNLADAPKSSEPSFPLSLLLDVFQSIQKKDIPFMLVLTGLRTLLPKLVEARTFSERMFHVVMLDRLDEEASRDAIQTPVARADCPVKFDEESVRVVSRESGGYPYFIQFICREAYDAIVQAVETDGRVIPIPLEGITQKLDADFFAGRWARATDRQRQLLWCAAHLDNAAGEFAAQDIVEQSAKMLAKRFSSSHTNQMLSTLSVNGLIYKNRWGRYSFAIPLLDRFILRQGESIEPAQLA